MELAIFHLRFNYAQVGTVVLTTEGSSEALLATDQLADMEVLTGRNEKVYLRVCNEYR